MGRFLLAISLIACLLPSCGGQRADEDSIERRVFAPPLNLTPKEHAAAPPTPIETALNPTAILLVTLDTTRADHLGVYGYDKATSPALDRIAAEGVRAAHAVSPMPTTDPAHLSIFTGLHPRSHGVTENGLALKDGSANMAAWAKSRGYRTAAFVSRAHVTPRALNLAGFDDASGPTEEQRDGRRTLEDTLDWLDGHGREPFFLWVHFFDPHRPYRPTRELSDRWVPSELQFEEPYCKPLKKQNLFRVRGFSLRQAISNRTMDRFSWIRFMIPNVCTEKQVQANIARYDAEINYMDGLVDELITHVRGLRVQRQQPLIIVAGDHGEAMGELLDRYDFAFNHGNYLYRGLTHVPLFLVWPGRIPPGSVIEGPVQLTDIAATVFDLVGDAGFATQGESLVPLFAGKAPSNRLAFTQRRTFSESSPKRWRLRGSRQYVVQDHRYTLIVSQPEGHMELLDLQGDRGSLTDVSSQLPEVSDRLGQELNDWLFRTPTAEGVSSEISEKKLEALKALGYIR